MFYSSKSIFLFLSLFAVSGFCDVRAHKKNIHIAGIFPIRGSGGWAGGAACVPAAMIALDLVSGDASLLADYNLVLHWNDSECRQDRGLAILYDFVHKPPQKLMLLGPGCATVTTISYGSSTPELSDRKKFPTFFRTHPSALSMNPGFIRLIKHYGWKKISILQEHEEVFDQSVPDLLKLCRKEGIEVTARQVFDRNPSEAVRNFKQSDARVIVGFFYELPARKVFCEACKQKLYGPNVVWLIIGWYSDNWFEVVDPAINCTTAELQAALEGHLTAESLIKNMNTNKTLSGLTTIKFFEDLRPNLIYNPNIISPEHAVGYVESPLAYDAVWAIALALNRSIPYLAKEGKLLEDFTYTDNYMAHVFHAAMQNVTFEGVSGLVEFTSQGDRISKTLLEQMQNGVYKTLGIYNPYTELIEWDPTFQEKWIGGRPPRTENLVVS